MKHDIATYRLQHTETQTTIGTASRGEYNKARGGGAAAAAAYNIGPHLIGCNNPLQPPASAASIAAAAAVDVSPQHKAKLFPTCLTCPIFLLLPH